MTVMLATKMARVVAALCVSTIGLGSALRAQTVRPLPKVRILATGGTIAGEQTSPGTLGQYEPTRRVNEIVASVPVVSQYAEIESEQFSNISSPSISPTDWVRLAQRINALFEERRDLAGIVVTHGTSRLEETAFFLHLTVKSDRPVVVVGAQRPPTGVGPDGPINLLSAVRVAAAADARGKGVMVVMDERVVSARDVIKLFPRSGGFDGAEMGVLGVVSTEAVEFFYQPVRRHTTSTEFDVRGVEALPRVGISYSYGGAQGTADIDAKAVIVATTGFAPEEGRYYESLRLKGIVIATTFPSGMSDRLPAAEQRANAARVTAPRALPPIVVVRHLTPLKARILMMLALTRTDDPEKIQQIFDSY